MIIDAHLHLTSEDIAAGFLDLMVEEDLYGLVTGVNIPEWYWLEKLAANHKNIILCYGLHPWEADQHTLEEITPFLQDVKIIGEIGMDSVWTDIDLTLQEEIFIGQLELAEKNNVPVVLHTKGQEQRIAEIISVYTMPVLVHWYSAKEHLDLYIERGCHFTIGPDVRENRAVQQVVEHVPLDRLFVETDGLGALEWVRGEKLPIQTMLLSLRDTMAYIAEVKDVSFAEVKAAMVRNLHHFLAHLK